MLLAAALPVVAGSLVYLGYSTEHAALANKRAELAAVQVRLDKFTAKQAGLQAQGDLVGLRSKREAALEDALSKSTAWNVMLQDLARVLPKGVSLTNLSAQSPTPSASVARASAVTSPISASTATAPLPTSFTLVGIASSHDQIAHLLARLSLLPMLTNVSLTSTSTVTPSTATAATSTATGEKAPAKKAGPPQVTFFVSAGVVPLGQGAAT